MRNGPLVAVAALLLHAVTPAASAQVSGAPDAVVVSETEDGGRVELPADRLLTIELQAQTSTGYSWSVDRVDGAVLALAGREQRSASVPGGVDVDVLHFRGVAKGRTTIRLVYGRPWEFWSPAAVTFTLEVDVAGAYTGGDLVPSQAPRLAARGPVESGAAGALPAALNLCDPGDGSFGRCTPIKDQGQCGSCWAFATTGAFENLLRFADPGRVPDLSEQYLVSCDGGSGCAGGYADALEYFVSKWRAPPETEAGAVYEADFPYQASDVPCGTQGHPHRERLSDFGQLGYGQVPVETLKQAMERYGPIVTHVCADAAFGWYRGGVFHGSCRGWNHLVVLVGWGESDGEGYWLLRNSWGTWWGEQGYMRIAHGANDVGSNSIAAVYHPIPPADVPPFASAGSRWRVCENQEVTLRGELSHDREGAIVRHEWVQIGGPPVALTASSTAYSADLLAPTLAADAVLTFLLTVTDTAGQTASAETRVDVLAPCPIVARAGAHQTVSGGATVWLDGSASTVEPGVEVLGRYWMQTDGPPVALAPHSQWRVTFVAPEVETDMALTFQLTLSDGYDLESKDTTTVTVRANRLPVADAGPAQSASEGAVVWLDGSASQDPDGSIARFEWRQLAGTSVQLLGAGTARATFIAPPTEVEDVLVFELTVTDDEGAQATARTEVTVGHVNRPPLAEAGTGQTVRAGVEVILDGSGSADPEGALASYAWTQSIGPAVVLAGAESVQARFTAPAVSVDTTLAFRLSVSDGAGATASDDVEVLVQAGPSATSRSRGCSSGASSGAGAVLLALLSRRRRRT